MLSFISQRLSGNDIDESKESVSKDKPMAESLAETGATYIIPAGSEMSRLSQSPEGSLENPSGIPKCINETDDSFVHLRNQLPPPPDSGSSNQSQEIFASTLSSPEEMRFSSPQFDEVLDVERDNRAIGITKSNQRRYSNVVAEFVHKRDSIDPEMIAVNPSTLLTMQADEASPKGLSYVSWQLETSDESFDGGVHNMGRLTDMSSDERPYSVEKDENLRMAPSLKIFSESGTALSPVDIDFNSQKSFEYTGLNESSMNDIEILRSASRKSISFDRINPKSTNGASGKSEPYRTANNDMERLKSTSTPMPKLDADDLTFTYMSAGSSIQCCTPGKNANGKGNITEPSIQDSTKRGKSSSKTFLSPSKLQSHRGTYSLNKLELNDENSNKYLKVCLNVTGVLGILQIIAAFIIWFVVIPNIESEEDELLKD